MEMDFKNIDEFVKQTGFKIQVGEIGIMRPCVGILQEDVESYICYRMEDSFDDFGGESGRDWSEYKPLWVHTVAESKAPDRAYHKGPYLAVLYDEKDSTIGNLFAQKEAMEALDKWIGDILDAGYQIKEYESPGLMDQLMGTGKTETHKGIADK